MKFSVAPESSRAIVSALFDLKCIKTRSVIDFRAEISWSRYRLSSADLIRQWENPPFSLRIGRSSHFSAPGIGR